MKMNYLELLGSDLKSEPLVDLFERHDVSVVYEYDRKYENRPDRYVAQIPSLGLEFIFDDQRKLQELFIKSLGTLAGGPFACDESLRVFEDKGEAEEFARRNSIEFTEATEDEMGFDICRIRFLRDEYSIEYQFVRSALHMITIRKGNA
ncbi:hypothetical protein [Pelagicoccus albus]|uniref:Uncharacterized protein n=1 Tax=Pelagicoccus albus TaxID=415222 RepID=A0A7X1B5V2_9BACT|nr:hypothetical protein [Pelagicoccus albus]MBC2606092.1 hypothetical protein [Pelagicoccus albus]